MKGENTRQKSRPWYRKEEFAWSVAIFLLVFVVFSPAIGYGFFNMDDLPLIERKRLLLNHGITDLGAIFSDKLWTPYYKPLVYLSWMFEKEVVGLKPWLLHFNNILLHCINALLVFFLARRILPAFQVRENLLFLAGTAAVLWAIHPMRVESVVWAVERKDVLFGMFFLLACHAWLHFLQGKGKSWILWTVVFYVLSCLSKSMGITFPAIALLLHFVVRPGVKFRVLQYLPLAGVLLLMLFLYGYISTGSGAVVSDPLKSASAVEGFLTQLPPLVQNAVIASARFCLLLLHTLFPFRLSIVYPREWILETLSIPIIAFPFVIMLLYALIFRRGYHRSVYAFALLWFGICLSPVLSGEGVGTNFLSDRYSYIPAFGVSLGILLALSWLSGQRKRLLVGIVSAILLFCIVLTFLQVRKWETNLSLWQQAIGNYPENWYALYNRAKLIASSDPNQAISDLNQAIAVMPGKEELQYARGVISQQNNHYEAALKDFTAVLARKPAHYEALLNRGNVHRAMKDFHAAIADYSQAIAVRPKFWKAWNNRGLAYADIGNIPEAMSNYAQAIAGDPAYPPPYLNRAYLRLRPEIADYPAAISDFDIYLSYFPDNHEALFRRGYAHFRTGSMQKALSDMDKAIRLHPNEGFYYVGRSQVYDALGNAAEAAADQQRAKALGKTAN